MLTINVTVDSRVIVMFATMDLMVIVELNVKKINAV